MRTLTARIAASTISAAAVLSACGDGPVEPGDGSDPTPLVVLAKTPASGAIGVALEPTITARFSEELDPASVSSASFTISPRVAAQVFYGFEERTAWLVPTTRLAMGTTYTVTISTAVRDSAGHALRAPVTWSFTTRTPAPPTFASLSVGYDHSCALTLGGTAYCWGSNGSGQIGDVTRIVRWNPVPVAGGLRFASLAMGAGSSCGLTSEGVAYCWGGNPGGRLGDGSDLERLEPTRVAGGLRFTALSLGGHHTCGLAVGGAAYCWGLNAFGFLGIGMSGGDRWTPAPVAAAPGFVSISIGIYQSCALRAPATAYCWGYNWAGEVGDGTTTTRWEPVPVAGGLNFASLSAGAFHSCGLTTDGTAYCWGWNEYLQLGDGTATNRSIPTPVSGGLRFTALSGGGHHTCGLTSAGAAYCWGWNDHGQLGDGTQIDRSSPVLVAGDVAFASVHSGIEHTCGRTAAGEVYCWGRNDQGQLGDGTSTDRHRPTRVVP